MTPYEATLQALTARYGGPLTGPMPLEIKGMVRNDLPALFVALGFKEGAEIGVWHGEYTARFCEAGLRMWAIDPWVAYPEYRDHTRHDKIAGAFDVAKARLSAYPKCRIIRKFSVEAAKEFKDGSLDYAYLDGNHSFFDCVQDLTLWSRKVRSGGIIAGHDYDGLPMPLRGGNEFIKVKEAVDGFTQAHNISPWFLLGRRRVRPGEPHERPRSFLWVKP